MYHRLRGYLPRRRRRVWRYVSGRRRGAGLVGFACLVLVGYGYWYLTNDARVSRKVVTYLSRWTGGRVKLDRAQFSLFEGIRASNLRVYLSDQTREPFFQAREVLLDHRPSRLLFRGRLEPTRLVCVHPSVTLIEDEKGQLNVTRIFRAIARSRPAGKAPRQLPEIRLRDGELVRRDVKDGEVGRRKGLNIALLPDAEKLLYHLRFEGPDEAGCPMRASGTIDLVSGDTHIEGLIGLERLDDTLPSRYRQWRRRYKLTGSARWATEARVGVTSSSAPGKLQRGVVRLADVCLELPPKEGGVKLVDVAGELVFDHEGVEIKKLTGRISEWGKAAFTLTGRYHGYNPGSPFQISAGICDLNFPLGGELTGPWGEKLARLNEQLSPAGPVDVDLTARREAEGAIVVTGQAELRGVSLSMPKWPLRAEGVRGKVLLDGDRAKLVDLRGRHNQAEVTIAGQVSGSADRPACDILLTVRDLAFSQQLYDALPKSYRKAWDSFSPRGSADFLLHHVRVAGQQRGTTTTTIRLTGDASLEYSRFPYRIDRAEGEVVVDGQGTLIRSVRGRAGPMRCLVTGRSVGKGERRRAEVQVAAQDVPLDERLARALSGSRRAAYEACRLSGRASIANAVVRRRGDDSIEFEIPLALADASLCHRSFPYRIDRASGRLRITPGAVEIEDVTGRHGRAEIKLQGRVLLKDPSGGMDLVAKASELPLDSELRKALPPEAGTWWDLLSPAGTASVTINVRKTRSKASAGGTGPAKLRTDYRLVLSPRNMQVRYRHFPILLRQLAGRAEIQPGKLRLKAFTGLAGDARVALDGQITAGLAGEQADLSVSTGPVALDKQLIASLPSALVRTLRLRPGGTAAFALRSLKVRGGSGAMTRPADTRPTQPDQADTQPAAPRAWSWSGRITLNQAVLDLGFGGKTVTGRIEGRMGCAGPIESLSADAVVALDEMRVGPHRLQKFSARLSKSEASPILRINEISAEALKGRLAGFARVRLGDTPRYGLSLSVEDIDLAELLTGGRPEAKQRLKLVGLLSGSLRMTATSGDQSSWRAAGKLRISRGRLYRLPVLLGFLHLVYLTLPSDSAFSSAEVSYYLRGNTLVFREIHLQGSALSMLGAGTMDVKTEQLKLTFLTGPPHKLPRLAMLSEVIDGLASTLMAVRVTGTLSKPKRRAVPLRNPYATLRELYDPESQ